MGLSSALARLASTRLHLLLLESPGGFHDRVRAERAVLERGWQLAESPAGADAVLVCGPPQPAPWAAATEALWEQLPGPRSRGVLAEGEDVEPVLELLVQHYLDPARQRADATNRTGLVAPPDDDGAHDPHHPDAQHEPGDSEQPGMGHDQPDRGAEEDHHRHRDGGHGTDHADGGRTEHQAHQESGPDAETGRDDAVRAGTEPAGTEHGGPAGAEHTGADDAGPDHGAIEPGSRSHGEMDHGGMAHGGHEHHMEMSGPGGIALASGRRDRDGLEMDVLQVRLGPGLACWPSGLLVWCSLQGDTVTEVEIEAVATATPDEGPAAPLAAARRLDAALSVLRLAGAVRFADRARRLLDLALRDDPDGMLTDALRTLRDSTARSRSLRWSLRGVGAIEPDLADERGWPTSWAGDVRTRLGHLLSPPSAPARPAEPAGPAHPDRPAHQARPAHPARPEHPEPVEGLRLLADALPALLPGLDLAAARLTVVSLVGHPLPAAVPVRTGRAAS